MPPPTTTTLAKLLAPTALLLAALLGTACGGLSERRDEGSTPGSTGTTPASTATNGGTATLGSPGDHDAPSSSDQSRCEDVCGSCLAELGISCGGFCRDVYANAQSAGCTTALSSLFACHQRGNTCASSACGTENNALSVCVISYCDEHDAPICSAPL